MKYFVRERFIPLMKNNYPKNIAIDGVICEIKWFGFFGLVIISRLISHTYIVCAYNKFISLNPRALLRGWNENPIHKRIRESLLSHVNSSRLFPQTLVPSDLPFPTSGFVADSKQSVSSLTPTLSRVIEITLAFNDPGQKEMKFP